LTDLFQSIPLYALFSAFQQGDIVTKPAAEIAAGHKKKRGQMPATIDHRRLFLECIDR
jgi:hypothetical protein